MTDAPSPLERTEAARGSLSYFPAYTDQAVRRELHRVFSSAGLLTGIGLILKSAARNLTAYAFYAVARPSFNFRGRSFRYYGGLCLFSQAKGTIPFILRMANVISKVDSERAIEVPIGIDFTRNVTSSKLLEIGNVLSYYDTKSSHSTVDLYETLPGVINEDALTFNPGKRYDAIVSISTVEHIGFDEVVPRPEKPIEVIRHLIALLNEGGRLLITVPYRYNPAIDRYLEQEGFRDFEVTVLSPGERRWTWREVPLTQVGTTPHPILILTYPRAIVE